MPTVFCKCDECNYFHNFPLTHRLNNVFNLDYEKMLSLKQRTLPTEIATKIVRMSQVYTTCVRCNTKLCESHANRARQNGGLCSQCCWEEIS